MTNIRKVNTPCLSLSNSLATALSFACVSCGSRTIIRGMSAQIGGLSVATFITLLLVPVLYVIFVLDLKLVKWEKIEKETVVVEQPVAGEA